MNKIIGWIGTGIMGNSMCSHLIDAGYQAFVYNRTTDKTQALVQKGAILCTSAKEVAQKADVIFTIVGYPKDVREVYFSENGIFASDLKGKVLVDMTTTQPSLAKEIFEEAKKRGATSLDAPVSGGDRGAREATLSIMVGGEKETFDEIYPLFQILGKSIILEGEAGAGQHTKMANQITIAGTMIGVSEALVYARRMGLDVSKMIDTISGGAAGCWTLNNLATRVVKGDLAPGFMIDHFIKDMKIAIEESQRIGLKLQGLELVCSLYEELQKQDYGKNGTQALVRAIDKLAF